MAEALITTLHTHFGFSLFRPGQAEAIASLLSDQHTLAIMPTGAGKSLIYQLAALHRPGVTLVISPLIALMKDQVDSLTRRKIPATFINSTLAASEQRRRLREMVKGAYRLIYVAPERLRSATFLQALRQIKVGLLAIDEAHCLSQWGHDFRPDYLHLATARHQLGEPLTIALTATATPQVQDDIVKLLALASAARVVTGFNRPNLSFEVLYAADPVAKLNALQNLLAGLKGGRAIIYTGTRRDAEEASEFIRAKIKIAAQHYHAGVAAELRTQIQNAFMAGDLPVVVATNAFGMGIDRPDVRLVAHFSMPGTLEAYYQEAGRAGRDGEAAQATLLYHPQDRALQEWFIENDTTTVDEVRKLYDTLRKSGRPEVGISLGELFLRTGFSEVKLKLGLAHLELGGIVQRLGDEGPQLLIRLDQWDEKAIHSIAADIEARRRHRRKQLAKMVAYAEANACRRRMLLDHFGDSSPTEAPRCCDNCLTKKSTPTTLQRGDFPELSQSEQTALVILDAVRRLKWGIGREKLAQMLKGSKAKVMQQFGYHKSPYYGRLAQFSLQTILDCIEQLRRQSYFKIVGGRQPVLRLTPIGEAAIKARAAISLKIAGQSQEHKPAREEISETVTVTALSGESGATSRRLVSRSQSNDSITVTPQGNASLTERRQHIKQLGETCSATGVSELIEALRDTEANIRCAAVLALKKIGDRRAAEPIMTLLRNEAIPQIREFAVTALGRINDDRARPLLEKIANDKSEFDHIRKLARQALER